MTLLELFRLLRKHLRLVVLLPIIFAIATGLYTKTFLQNQYTATSSMYVLAQQSEANATTLYSDLTASQMVTNDVAKLLQSSRITNQVGSEVGVKGLRGYSVKVTSETTSRVITLSVTGPDSQTAADIVNRMIEDVSGVAQSVMNVESVNAIDQAQAPTSPSGPNRPMYVGIAALVGLFASIVIVVLSDMVNTRVRGSEDLEGLLDVPIIGHIPYVNGGR